MLFSVSFNTFSGNLSSWKIHLILDIDLDISLQSQLDFQSNQIDELNLAIGLLIAQQDKTILQRMSYLTWMLANPLTLVLFPTFISIVVEIIINNWGTLNTEWSFSSLTNNTNWTIPILVSIIGLIVSFGNKLYQIIQEKGDMSLLKELEVKINGLNQRLDKEQKKRDAEYKANQEKRDAEYKADQEKRDAVTKAALDEIGKIKIGQARVEEKIENQNKS